MGGIWNSVKDVATSALDSIHSALVPIFGEHAWGWAIIALTVIIRVLLLPLAVKQIRSMRAMQGLQPKIKQLQKKYKVDRDLMRKDPETYRARKQKLNEEMMALYKEEGVNPASGCLPLVLQAPVFLALFQVLRDFEPIRDAQFYFFTSGVAEGNERGQGLGAFVSEVGWPGWLLIVLMSATMFWSQRQMMARNAATAEGAMAQQQKIMMYVMPVFLAAISFNFPLGVLLYWVTTNLWQMAQQSVMLREVSHEVEERTAPKGGRPAAASDGKGSKDAPSKGAKSKGTPSKAAGDSRDRAAAKDQPQATPKRKKSKPSGADRAGNAKGAPATGGPDNGQSGKRKRDHLPKRGDTTSR
jgi:YidC/Oxa1 family membrane protein insertase